MASKITEVRLLSVPLENDYKHTLWFLNLESQISYFAGRTVHTGYNFSYQRKDGYIAYPLPYDSLIGVNYVMYKNASYGDKWFFAFITDMKYINDERTDIYIETDVMQTWRFDYTVRPSFVEREHVASDRMGEHIVDENLQIGEYVCNEHNQSGVGMGLQCIVVGVSQDPEGNQVSGTIYNGMYSGLKYYGFGHSADGIAALKNWLASYDKDAAADAIQCMFLAPAMIAGIPVAGSEVTTGTDVKTQWINHYTDNLLDFDMTFSAGKLDGYTPKNNKLLSYPYRYLLCSNNNGMAVPMHYEDFRDNNGNVISPKFTIEGCLTPGCSVRLIPNNYKGIESNDEEGINLGKYPALNWTSDVFTNWLTQNAVNIMASVAGDIVQIGAGTAMTVATGGIGAIGGASSIASGVTGITNTVGEVYKASKVPAQSRGNTNCGDVITATHKNDFHFYDMSIKSQFAKIVDDYFTMFGYKINRVKIPDFYHRENYWYTKTIDVNIDGAIPMNDMNKIRDCYNRGITFWCNPENIGDYSVSNSITG